MGNDLCTPEKPSKSNNNKLKDCDNSFDRTCPNTIRNYESNLRSLEVCGCPSTREKTKTESDFEKFRSERAAQNAEKQGRELSSPSTQSAKFANTQTPVKNSNFPATNLNTRKAVELSSRSPPRVLPEFSSGFGSRNSPGNLNSGDTSMRNGSRPARNPIPVGSTGILQNANPPQPRGGSIPPYDYLDSDSVPPSTDVDGRWIDNLDSGVGENTATRMYTNAQI